MTDELLDAEHRGQPALRFAGLGAARALQRAGKTVVVVEATGTAAVHHGAGGSRVWSSPDCGDRTAPPARPRPPEASEG